MSVLIDLIEKIRLRIENAMEAETELIGIKRLTVCQNIENRNPHDFPIININFDSAQEISYCQRGFVSNMNISVDLYVNKGGTENNRLYSTSPAGGTLRLF